MTISYNYTIPVLPVTDECPGQRVFYSLTGAANSWMLITNFSEVTTTGRLTATLSLGIWSHGTDLFILWLDDNNETGQDGAFTIDDFAVSDVVPAGSSAISAAFNAATGEITITWFGGTLVETTQLLNGGTVWTDVPENPTSRYTFTPAPGTQRFFAVRL